MLFYEAGVKGEHLYLYKNGLCDNMIIFIRKHVHNNYFSGYFDEDLNTRKLIFDVARRLEDILPSVSRGIW